MEAADDRELVHGPFSRARLYFGTVAGAVVILSTADGRGWGLDYDDINDAAEEWASVMARYVHPGKALGSDMRAFRVHFASHS